MKASRPTQRPQRLLRRGIPGIHQAAGGVAGARRPGRAGARVVATCPAPPGRRSGLTKRHPQRASSRTRIPSQPVKRRAKLRPVTTEAGTTGMSSRRGSTTFIGVLSRMSCARRCRDHLRQLHAARRQAEEADAGGVEDGLPRRQRPRAVEGHLVHSLDDFRAARLDDAHALAVHGDPAAWVQLETKTTVRAVAPRSMKLRLNESWNRPPRRETLTLRSCPPAALRDRRRRGAGSRA